MFIVFSNVIELVYEPYKKDTSTFPFSHNINSQATSPQAITPSAITNNENIEKEYYTKLLWGDEDPSDKFFVILSDGYTKHEQNKFLSDAKKLKKEIIYNDSFIGHKANFTVYALMTHSKNSTLKKKEHELIKSSYFASEDPNKDRNLPINLAKKQGLAGDQFIVLINSEKFIGVSYKPKNKGIIYISSDFEKRDQNILHELGHTIADLADTYVPINKVPYYVEAPNLTRHKAIVPWFDFLDHPDIGIFPIDGTVWYRPSNNCIMMGIKVNVHPSGEKKYIERDFCIVCQDAISKSLVSFLKSK